MRQPATATSDRPRLASHGASATEHAREASQPESAQYLTFLLGREAFALGILSIKEIIEYQELTVVPMMPASVKGVINLRGAVVPVVDLRARFGWAAAEITKKSCIVIVEARHSDEGRAPLIVGALVDAVSEVIEIHRDDIEPAPEFGTSIRADFIEGMGKVKGRFVMLLDVDQVLSRDTIHYSDAAGAAPALPN